jgi:hypothetical protein
MNGIEEVMFSRIVDNDKKNREKLYQTSSGGWHWFKIVVIIFILIIIFALLGI